MAGKFQPGQTGNPNGRPKGAKTKNKVPAPIKELLREWAIDELKNIKKTASELKPAERLRFLVDILPYCTPKLVSQVDAEDVGFTAPQPPNIIFVQRQEAKPE